MTDRLQIRVLYRRLAAIRSIGVSEVLCSRWRREFGALKSDQVKRLKDLETENTRLRRAVSDLRFLLSPSMFVISMLPRCDDSYLSST